jgi:hypothetical protein
MTPSKRQTSLARKRWHERRVQWVFSVVAGARNHR